MIIQIPTSFMLSGSTFSWLSTVACSALSWMMTALLFWAGAAVFFI